MKTLSIVLASLLFVSLRLFAGEVGENSKPLCIKHNDGKRKEIEKDVKPEVAKEESKKLEGTAR
jgi:hypothetical protein